MERETNPEWFAIQTKIGGEDIAVQSLGTLGLETFLPMARWKSRQNSKASRRARPLFPSYCFARFRPVTHLHAIRYSRGVLRVVGAANTPWPVDDSIITDIRERLNSEGLVELESRSILPGERVRICNGPLAGWSGIFDSELDDHVRVAILLQGIQQARLLVHRESVELAEAN